MRMDRKIGTERCKKETNYDVKSVYTMNRKGFLLILPVLFLK